MVPSTGTINSTGTSTSTRSTRSTRSGYPGTTGHLGGDDGTEFSTSRADMDRDPKSRARTKFSTSTWPGPIMLAMLLSIIALLDHELC